MLHFAYGSNMSHEPMQQRCPDAQYLGIAVLRRHRFIIMANGYASIATQPSGNVYGVLWRISPRDLAALDAYENVLGGLYRRSIMPVIRNSRSMAALVYIGAEKREGAPRKGHMELVLAAARENKLPEEYIERLARLAPGRFNLGSGTGDSM